MAWSFFSGRMPNNNHTLVCFKKANIWLRLINNSGAFKWRGCTDWYENNIWEREALDWPWKWAVGRRLFAWDWVDMIVPLRICLSVWIWWFQPCTTQPHKYHTLLFALSVELPLHTHYLQRPLTALYLMLLTIIYKLSPIYSYYYVFFLQSHYALTLCHLFYK